MGRQTRFSGRGGGSGDATRTGLRADRELVAAARVLTDFVYYARIYDVIDAAEYRCEGVGAELLEAVVEHSELSAENPVLLYREGLVPFYESGGFEPYPETVAQPGSEDEQPRQLVYTGRSLRWK